MGRTPMAAPAPAALAAAPYVEQFRRLYAERAARSRGLVEGARTAALAELVAHGFPLRRDEEWSHTPLRAVAAARYRLGSAAPASAADGWGSELVHQLIAGEPVLLLTCNGWVAGPDVAAAAGRGSVPAVVLPGVRRAAWDAVPRAAETFSRPLSNAFTRLARVFGDHTVLHCDAAADGVPLHLVHVVEPGALAAPRVSVGIAPGARVTLVESCVAVDGPASGAGMAPADVTISAAGRSASNGAAALDRAAAEGGVEPGHATAGGAAPDQAPADSAARRDQPRGASGSGGAPADAASLSCADTEIRLGAGAVLTYVRVQAVGTQAFDFGTTTVVQERGSELHALSVALGGRIARHTCNVLAAAPETLSRLGGATLAAGGQLLDHHTYLEHAAPGGASRQLYKTVLGGGGHGVFSGRILVRPVAQQTDAFQLNQNLLLDDARVDTKPQLEIGADDVRCTHGATTGRLDDDQLFYLQARAIPRAAAVHMMARGFLDQVVGDLPAAALRPRLLKLLHRRLDGLDWRARR